jgi:hypothetical protein
MASIASCNNFASLAISSACCEPLAVNFDKFRALETRLQVFWCSVRHERNVWCASSLHRSPAVALDQTRPKLSPIQQFESVHTGHFNVRQHYIGKSIFYRLEALRRVARQCDLCLRAIQESA